jgi:hypothetical protein
VEYYALETAFIVHSVARRKMRYNSEDFIHQRAWGIAKAISPAFEKPVPSAMKQAN